MDTLYTDINNMVNENCEGFIPIADLESLWTPGIEDFVKNVLQPRISDVQIEFVHNHWLKTISLLIRTLEGIAWDPEVVNWICDCINRGDDWDAKLHIASRDQLAFLKTEQISRFMLDRKLFTALVLKEGEDYTLGSEQKLPFIGKSKELGKGMGETVTGHEVAPGHLILKEVSSRIHFPGFAEANASLQATGQGSGTTLGC